MPPDTLPAVARLRQLAQRRPALVAAAAVAVLVAVLVSTLAGTGMLGRDSGDAASRWLSGTPGPTAAPTTAAVADATPEPDEAPQVTLSAVGDTILGDAGRLPPDDGAGFFAGVQEALPADLVMGNLEQPLTGDTGHRKCPEDSTACHAFRAPRRYAAHLRDAGFHLMNLANNHGNDYGPDGRANTRSALEEHGIAHTGERDQITVHEAGGVAVAVVGFSPYSWTNALNDHAQAADVVGRAAHQADLVVVQVHMGAEGADATRVRPGSEEFFGEDRGDPMAFSRAVIDAGADLVVGHGPHVLRGLEFYQGKLIAYSLGNFAGAGVLGAAGPLGLGAVLRVTLTAAGEFVTGELVSTHMYDGGLPTVDPQRRGLELVREITGRDFPDSGAVLDDEGVIEPPRTTRP